MIGSRQRQIETVFNPTATKTKQRVHVPISAGIDAAAPRRHTPPTMLDVQPARLRSRAASAIHGPTTSTHHLS